MIRTCTELFRLESFPERYKYLRLGGEVGASTFGFDRYLNQQFYRSKEWRDMRSQVIARDEGCDLGVWGFDLHDRVLVHHMNPVTPNDIARGYESILNPEYLITVSHDTHNAIHYGDESLLKHSLVERIQGDTKLW